MEPISETPMTRQERAAIARVRASFSAFVNVHFTTLPDAVFVQRIRSREFATALDALASDHSIPDLAAGAALMQSYVNSTLDTSEAQLSEALGVDRTRLYRGVAPGYGPPPPCEAVWMTSAGDTVAVLKQLADVYLAAGMMLSPEARERLDYVGVQLDYLSRVARSEAEAWEVGEEAKGRELLQQQAEFLSAHLAQWLPAFIEKALPEAVTDFYRGHMMMLRGFLNAEQERLPALLAEAVSN